MRTLEKNLNFAAPKVKLGGTLTCKYVSHDNMWPIDQYATLFPTHNPILYKQLCKKEPDIF